MYAASLSANELAHCYSTHSSPGHDRESHNHAHSHVHGSGHNSHSVHGHAHAAPSGAASPPAAAAHEIRLLHPLPFSTPPPDLTPEPPPSPPAETGALQRRVSGAVSMSTSAPSLYPTPPVPRDSPDPHPTPTPTTDRIHAAYEAALSALRQEQEKALATGDGVRAREFAEHLEVLHEELRRRDQ
eukprot:Hpha_TRINITY_DN18777_c0_g1::TRINITY_DN18777_c0_g1_i1::g.47462::m.47462